jgi:hypothetical protein
MAVRAIPIAENIDVIVGGTVSTLARCNSIRYHQGAPTAGPWRLVFVHLDILEVVHR